MSTAVKISRDHEATVLERMRRLCELDKTTKVPFIIVELRGIGNHDGYVAICGKDEYGVYSALDKWLTKTWRCRKLDAGECCADTELQFSDAMYQWENFTTDGEHGTNNMGLSTMRLVDFMCRELSWTLGAINGGNLGEGGEIREQQIIFRAPHPMNIVARHMMVKLRTVGLIELCSSDQDALNILHNYLTEKMDARIYQAHEYCDACYACPKFKTRGKLGDNNLGLLTTQVCDAVVSLLPGWSLVTMNGGNYGEDGTSREQRLVFRWDNHPLRENPHLLVELREAGFVQVSGQNVDSIYDKLQNWLCSTWACRHLVPKSDQESFCDQMLSWSPRDMLVASAEITGFFHELGWQMQVSSQCVVAVGGNPESREQQILFRPHQHGGEGIVEPHVFVELYTGEGNDSLYSQTLVTQVPANQRIRVCSVGDCGTATEHLSEFLCRYLGASARPATMGGNVKNYACDIFLSRGLANSNLAMVTQRLRDFMVDGLGWRFAVCNVCNMGPTGAYREQQLVFRFDGWERREIPPAKENNVVIDKMLFGSLEFPTYWKTAEVLDLKRSVSILSCDAWEMESLQEVVDHTFKRTLTRDRPYDVLGLSEEMPYRLEVVHAFRSEHAELYRRFKEKRSQYILPAECTPFEAKTRGAGALINHRLNEGDALLFHGTNPSSAMGILKTGFVLDHAGKTTGTMLGHGVYLAECASKSDEYARDDSGGSYPGLRALLLCRCFVGKPYVVHESGDHIASAKQMSCDCVVGDRESKVGTYKEFVFFDERQVFPEYAVIYRRQYNKSKVPRQMRQPVSGTTGKNWQVKTEGKGWINMPPDVTHELNKASQEGRATVQRNIAGANYTFNIGGATMLQVRQDTGAICMLRPPMRR
jgi:hypothetical protein